jgi:glycosyltransferase involved in cell wall biosynthesis
MLNAQAAERLPAQLVVAAVLGLADRGDLLDAYTLATRTKVLATLTSHTLRQLRQGLWQRGYVVSALNVAHVIEEVGATDSDRRAHRRLEGEAAVFTGNVVPAVRTPSQYTGIPGRVLHVVGRSLPDQAGYTIRTHNIAKAQRDAGLDPHIVTQTGVATDDVNAMRDEIDGITYHRFSRLQRNELPLDCWLRRHIEKVSELVEELRPAVLHAASDFINALAATTIGRAFGIPVVYESRGFWEETWLSRQADRYGWDLQRLRERHGLPDIYLWRQAIEDRMRREADHVVTLADVMADRVEAGGVPRERITVVPNAVAVADFPISGRNSALARQLGIMPRTVVIGYISSLVEYEGIDVLISAYAEVRGSVPVQTRLLIVGEGQVRGRLEEHAKALGMGDEVIFTGQVPHGAVVDYYGLIDIFVVPRRPVEVTQLVTPLKPFEAFSTGRTVVLSNVRALAAIADDSNAAALFEAGSPKSLATVLRDLLLDPERRQRLAKTGAAWVRAHRTWAATTDRYLGIYTSLGATSPNLLYPRPTVETSIEELRATVAAGRLADEQKSDARTEPMDFRWRPFVCGAIGAWEETELRALRDAVPIQLERIYQDNHAVLFASGQVREWRNDQEQGFYWWPFAAAQPPSNWQSAAEDNLAAGLVVDAQSAVLHTCALGLQELYIRTVGRAVYFSVRIDPLLALESGALRPDPVAWACTFALGCPIGDSTPFVEVRRATAGAMWRARRESQSAPVGSSFEPRWVAEEGGSEPSPGSFAELLRAAVPEQGRYNIPLSGGRDSRLLAALARRRLQDDRLAAWTISTDDGSERDIALAGPVADELGLTHRVLVPSVDSWPADAAAVRSRLQYQSWYHTWYLPLARLLRGDDAAILDGLGGGLLLDGTFFMAPDVTGQPSSKGQRIALLRRLTQRRLGHPTLLSPEAASWVEKTVEETFLSATSHLDGHRHMLPLSVLATRTTRAIALAPLWLLAPEAGVYTPFIHPDVICAALRVPLSRKLAGQFYAELLQAVAGAAATLPLSKDQPRRERPIARRQTSPPALDAIASAIGRDPSVRMMLGPLSRAAVTDRDIGLRVVRSRNEHVTLLWAALLAEWHERYRDRLDAPLAFPRTGTDI